METLIVTTDFSGSSVHAAKYAAAISGPLGVRTLVLYHSYSVAPPITEVPLPEPEELASAHEDRIRALKILESQISPLMAHQVSVECVTDDLPLLSGVEQLLKQYGGGLIVAGMTGKGGVEKLLVGSHTALLAGSCRAPVLIVPEEAEFTPITKAVFACDLKNVDETIPTHLIDEIIEKLDCRLLVLNVETTDSRMAGDVIPEQYKLHEKLNHLKPEYHYIEHGSVAEGIMAFADTQRAGLVLAMPRSRGFFDSLFHRSVTKKLAHHTRLPLLLLRSE